MDTRVSRRFWAGSWPLLLALLCLLTACTDTSAPPTASRTPTATMISTHPLTHAMGTTQIPIQPQRVVVLDTEALDDSLALGITPVGAVIPEQGASYPGYLQEASHQIPTVGTTAQPDLQAITKLKPDLILGSKVYHEDIYSKLSLISPAIYTETVGSTWKANLTLYAKALNKEQEGTLLLQQYQQSITALKTQEGESLGKTHVSVLRIMPDRVRIYMQDTFIGRILQDAGLPRPVGQDQQKKFSQDNTYDNIAQMDGDVIFMTLYDRSNDQLKALTNQPDWQQLNAVKDKKVYQVDDDTWMEGLGIGAATHVVADLTKDLAPAQ
ncbi:iron siderophore-binding protein [Ktedonobacter sp. SOSP1-85]|uniref:ABC transporter substrate-binding protein n=1 Tax=Ktedonobacter sp. SOSP1-85 TaxID=2778367 RepID=UPI001A26F905|nr:iron-siderophore ABC transporter substrate-binding protein [Ktedonobacter sp. SOSP1-85]GHO72563.1 iron siderophore-binding protein [Ktedonobacter sp. SOSP1-85]